LLVCLKSRVRPAMAPAPQPLPGVALDLFLFLERAEAAVRAASEASGLHKGGSTSSSAKIEETLDEQEALWRAKVCAYERTLRVRLDQWPGLGEVAAERLRSRIEDLTPALDKALSQRRVVLAPAPPPPPPQRRLLSLPKPEGASLSEGTGAVPAVSSTSRAVPTVVGGDRPALRSNSVAPSDAAMQREQLMGGAKQRKPASAAVAKDARQHLEAEMMDLSDGMKGAASSFLATLKKDNSRLDDMSDSMQKNIDNVTAANAKGKKLMWSSSLSFFCTMIMLIISVVIFFMMIPFIIMT